jgi:hypothetical protein
MMGFLNNTNEKLETMVNFSSTQLDSETISHWIVKPIEKTLSFEASISRQTLGYV